MKFTAKMKLALYTVALVFFGLVNPAYAQEGTTTTAAPQGVGVLLVIMGLGAIAVVGLFYWTQNRPDDAQTDSAEE